MEGEKGTIIVPWDFTTISEYALEHAIKIIQFLPTHIQLLHIANKELTEEQVKSLEEQLRHKAEEYSQTYNVHITDAVVKGDIYKTIAEYAESLEAKLVVMGTHGIKGIQKVKGSRAFKVMYGSKIPFLIIKDKPRLNEGIKRIVVPIDGKSENIEKMDNAIFFANQLGLKIYIITSAESHKSTTKQIHINLNVAKKLLAKNQVDYEIQTAQKKAKFSKETIRYAQDIKANLILIITTGNKLKDYLKGEHEQYIIDNDAKIPVMCVNPTINEFI